MTENPYLAPTSAEELETERTVIVDPLTGAITTIGARIERLSVDAHGRQRRDVLHAVAASADHAQLLSPFSQPLWPSAISVPRPLVHPFFSMPAGRPADAAALVT